jgi:DNA-binding CsgD family transcriptional regulator
MQKMRKTEKVSSTVDSSHENYLRLIEEPLRRVGLLGDHGPSQYLARVILDFPLAWAFKRLEAMDSIIRARTLVVTQGTHPAYLDCLASFHVSGVVNATDEPSLLSGIYSAATAQRTYHWKSNLTYMELRVSRALLQGLETREIASRLSISTKTVNAHISNVLCKTGTENRSQYLAQILAHN